MDELTTSSVDGLLEKIRLLASRPIPEFNRFEALNMLEALKNAAQDAKHEKAGYYKYTFETLREKVTLPNDQFRNFLFPLLGNKDQERVLGVIAKVEKNNRRNPVRQDFRAAGRAVFVVIIVIVLGTSNCIVYNGKGKWGLQVFPVGLHNSLTIQIEIVDHSSVNAGLRRQR